WNSIEPEPKYLQELVLKILAIVSNKTIVKLCTYYNSNTKKELSYFANEMTKNEVLEILNQTNFKTFEERLKKEGFDKDELLLFNNLDFSELYITRENLVLFLEENLDLNDKIFIDDLENFLDIEIMIKIHY
ncbi:12328_t:CDS:2, partial [Cetraspora pellucida]